MMQDTRDWGRERFLSRESRFPLIPLVRGVEFAGDGSGGFIGEGGEKGLSRQSEWQKKQNRMGRCQRCGDWLGVSSVHCDVCLMKHRVKSRKKAGCEAWKPGKRGRPPLEEAWRKGE